MWLFTIVVTIVVTAPTMSLEELWTIPMEEIQRARDAMQGVIHKTPLIPLNLELAGDTKIYLKLENLHPVGSFKIRGAYNALVNVPAERLRHGVFTCSAGNFAQGLAWSARARGIKCTIIVPDNAPKTKVDAIRRLGGEVVSVPYDQWWQVMVTRQYPGMTGHFIHPVCEREVIAGNGTMGLEILDDLPDVDAIISPFGGGGNVCGIASAIKAIKPDVRVIACEVETAAPLTASFAAKQPVVLEKHTPSFVDGMGGKSVFKEMWNLASHLIDDTCVLSLQEICRAIKLLAERNHIIAEGAGAAPVAAAQKLQYKRVVCIVSGGNIDTNILTTILQDKVPS